jgi:cytochrome P450
VGQLLLADTRQAGENTSNFFHSNGAPLIIPNGALIDLHIRAANADEELVGEQPHAVCPQRMLSDERAGAAVLSFGDGHHRCPGAYIAIAESDIFLRRLLAAEGLRMEQPPTLTWNDLVTGYELRNFVVAVD